MALQSDRVALLFSKQIKGRRFLLFKLYEVLWRIFTEIYYNSFAEGKVWTPYMRKCLVVAFMWSKNLSWLSKSLVDLQSKLLAYEFTYRNTCRLLTFISCSLFILLHFPFWEKYYMNATIPVAFCSIQKVNGRL